MPFLLPNQQCQSTEGKLATTDMGQKLGAVPLWGELSPHLTRRLSQGYLPAKWPLGPSSRSATIDMDRKLGAVPLLGAGAGSPSDTMWSGPRSACIPSFILIRPTVWPQYTNVTDRQDRTVVR